MIFKISYKNKNRTKLEIIEFMSKEAIGSSQEHSFEVRHNRG